MPQAPSMTGTVWRTPALRIEEVRVRGGTRLHGHGHREPHLCFLEAGAFRERHGEGTRRVEPGTLRSSPAGDEHDLTFSVDSRCILVLFPGDPGAADRPDPKERRFLRSPRIRGIMGRLAAELASPDDLSPLALEALGLELLAAAEPGARAAGGPPPPWLLRVRERLRDAPTAPEAPRRLGPPPGRGGPPCRLRGPEPHDAAAAPAAGPDTRTGPAGRGWTGRGCQPSRRGARRALASPGATDSRSLPIHRDPTMMIR